MRLFKYRIPLYASPLPLDHREGIVAETFGGFGEAAPLPGFSKETLGAALLELRNGRTTLPSVQFCLASAARPFPSAFPAIAISALVSTREEADAALCQGFRTLKVKVKGLSPDAAVRLVSSLQRPGLSLRIDANRRWSFEEALHVFRGLDPAGVEYVEEPLANPEEILKLPLLPIALDETLLERPSQALFARAKTLVLKPTLLGDKTAHWVHEAKKHGKEVVFSSSFESAIGLLHIALLHAETAPNAAAGLDTYRSFKHQPLPFPIREGRLCNDLLPPLDMRWLIPL